MGTEVDLLNGYPGSNYIESFHQLLLKLSTCITIFSIQILAQKESKVLSNMA